MYLKLIKNLIQETTVSDSPFYAYISISNICNAHCIFCNVHEETAKTNTLDLFALIHELKKMGVKYIHFTGGGEPFTNPDIWQYIELIKQLNMKLAVTTNGGCVDEDAARKLAGSSLDYIFFSLDSHLPLLHNSLRNSPGIWEKTTKAIGLLKKDRPDIKIVLNHLLNNQNIEHFNDMILLKKQIEYDYINPLLIKDCPELEFTPQQKLSFTNALPYIKNLAKQVHVDFLYDNIDFFSDHKTLLSQAYSECNSPCYFARSALYIDCPTGNVYPCDCTVHRDKNKYSLGNLQHQTLDEIWKGERRDWLKHSLETKRMSCKHYCDYANVFYNTKFMTVNNGIIKNSL